MTERAQLLSSLATTIADYRAGELPSPTPEHVDRWVRRFAPDVQVPLLRELDHVLKKTYFTRSMVEEFLGGLVTNSGIAGTNPGDARGHALLVAGPASMVPILPRSR